MESKSSNKKVKGYAIISKYDNSIMEAFEDFEMNDTFSSLKAARIYIKKTFTKKQWPNYNRDIKVVPCVITYKN